jgi:hypothetical protein
MSRVFLARCTWTVWPLTRKRTQWRSVTSTVKYHFPRCRLLSAYRSSRTLIQATDISERRVINCPNHKASQYLGAFVAKHQVGDGMGAHRTATADRCGPPRPDHPPSLQRCLYYQRAGSIPPMPLVGRPTGGGPSPEFAGTLTVEKCRRDDCFGLIGSRVCRRAACCARSRTTFLTGAPMTKLRSPGTAGMLACNQAFPRTFCNTHHVWVPSVRVK